MGKLGHQFLFLFFCFLFFVFCFALVSLFSNGDCGLEKLNGFLDPEIYDVVSTFLVPCKHVIHSFHALVYTVIQRTLVE